jgi:5-methylcytosine-specific restriction endonuclease McrA
MNKPEDMELACSMVKRLNQEVGLPFWYAEVFVAYGGKCVYCDEDLVSNRIAYSAAMIDHLLPRSKYPDFEVNQMNLVLSCASCNSIKNSRDPLNPGEDPEEMLKNNRAELIQRVRNEVQGEVRRRNGTWEKVAAILKS